MTAEQYIAENKRRLADINAPYDPITGLGCTACPRSKVNIADYYDAPRPVYKSYYKG